VLALIAALLTGRALGAGVEFAAIRPYLPGDSLRDVNRPVSLRRGQLHVNQRSAARAADLVVLVDALGGPGPVADATMDLAVHGAAAVVTAYLRVSDRAGLVVLGGLLRWLGPDPRSSGDRQFYRIAPVPRPGLGAASPEAPAILTPEGLFILAYLLLSDAPPALPHPARWLRQLIPLAVSALAVAATTLAALAIHPAPSPWLTLTGIAAAVAAYLIALSLIALSPITLPSLRRR
jgi:hypothetical protein